MYDDMNRLVFEGFVDALKEPIIELRRDNAHYKTLLEQRDDHIRTLDRQLASEKGRAHAAERESERLKMLLACSRDLYDPGPGKLTTAERKDRTEAVVKQVQMLQDIKVIPF